MYKIVYKRLNTGCDILERTIVVSFKRSHFRIHPKKVLTFCKNNIVHPKNEINSIAAKQCTNPKKIKQRGNNIWAIAELKEQ